MIRRPPRSTHCISSAASDVYKRQELHRLRVNAALVGESLLRAADLEAKVRELSGQ